MFGWGKLRIWPFVKLSTHILRIAWQQTRHIQVGQDIEFTVKFEIGDKPDDRPIEHGPKPRRIMDSLARYGKEGTDGG